MDRHTAETTGRGKNTDMVCMYGLMEVIIKEVGLRIRLKAMALISGLMGESM